MNEVINISLHRFSISVCTLLAKIAISTLDTAYLIEQFQTYMYLGFHLKVHVGVTTLFKTTYFSLDHKFQVLEGTI